MPNSYAETVEFTCPQCNQTFQAEVWLIVDAAQRPDLLERIRAGSLHDLSCPHCDQAGSADVPLLVFRPGEDPPLIFLPRQEATALQNQQEVDRLLAILKARASAAWQDDWITASDTLDWSATGSTAGATAIDAGNTGQPSPSPQQVEQGVRG